MFDLIKLNIIKLSLLKKNIVKTEKNQRDQTF